MENDNLTSLSPDVPHKQTFSRYALSSVATFIIVFKDWLEITKSDSWNIDVLNDFTRAGLLRILFTLWGMRNQKDPYFVDAVGTIVSLLCCDTERSGQNLQNNLLTTARPFFMYIHATTSLDDHNDLCMAIRAARAVGVPETMLTLKFQQIREFDEEASECSLLTEGSEWSVLPKPSTIDWVRAQWVSGTNGITHGARWIGVTGPVAWTPPSLTDDPKSRFFEHRSTVTAQVALLPSPTVDNPAAAPESSTGVNEQDVQPVYESDDDVEMRDDNADHDVDIFNDIFDALFAPPITSTPLPPYSAPLPPPAGQSPVPEPEPQRTDAVEALRQQAIAAVHAALELTPSPIAALPPPLTLSQPDLFALAPVDIEGDEPTDADADADALSVRTASPFVPGPQARRDATLDELWQGIARGLQSAPARMQSVGVDVDMADGDCEDGDEDEGEGGGKTPPSPTLGIRAVRNRYGRVPFSDWSNKPLC